MKFTEKLRSTAESYVKKIQAAEKAIADHHKNGIEEYSYSRYQEIAIELDEKRRMIQAEGVAAVDAIIAEYKAELSRRFVARGDELNAGDMSLLNSGYQLKPADLAAMFDRYAPDNHTMLRAIMEYCEKKEQSNHHEHKQKWYHAAWYSAKTHLQTGRPPFPCRNRRCAVFEGSYQIGERSRAGFRRNGEKRAVRRRKRSTRRSRRNHGGSWTWGTEGSTPLLHNQTGTGCNPCFHSGRSRFSQNLCTVPDRFAAPPNLPEHPEPGIL